MKILVADDSPLFRKILKKFLQSWGYEVVLAADGLEAQRILEGEDSPRLAILDCEMPGANGLELCDWIRTRKQKYVYTILLSAADDQSDVISGFQSGADDYLCKPFEELELKTRLKAGVLTLNRLDPLVDTWGRREIIKLADQELSRAKRLRLPLSVVLAELDFQDGMNGESGKMFSAEVLPAAVSRIAGTVRNVDQIGGYSDRQFLLILPDCSAEGAAIVAERVHQSFAETPVVSGVEVTIYTGAAQWSRGQEIPALLAEVEAALNRSKASGPEHT